ncbi:MAG: Lrp/AsnC family transcriptional regulator [Jatrophihabitans sp.]|nr:MAG: Lrp/AsnC family transcriptional regulator [Jatrophihabitans sp.]
MDSIDRELIRLLQRDARASYQELAGAVRLSANTVADRVRRLRASGVIRGLHAQLDPSALGRSLRIVSDIRLRDGVGRGDFERGLSAVPQVVAGMRVTGDYDFQLTIACVDTAEFEQVIDALKARHGVLESRSRLVLHEIDVDPTRLLDAH